MVFVFSAQSDADEKRLVYRHTLLVRITHWINAGVLLIMLMSGLQIFNAHAELYWGKTAHFDRPILSMSAVRASDGRIKGVTRIGVAQFDTTGVLGASGNLLPAI